MQENFNYARNGNTTIDNLHSPAFLTDIGTGHTSTVISIKEFSDITEVKNNVAWNQDATTQV